MVRRTPHARRGRMGRRLGMEDLEKRCMLDGSAGDAEQLPPAAFDPMQLHREPEACLSAAPADVDDLCGPIDALPGRDVHADSIGDDATPLSTGDDGFHRVHSYLDSVNDADVMSVVAAGNQLQVSALLFYVPATTVLSVIEGDSGDVIGEFGPPDTEGNIDGFIDCDCGDYGFIDLFPGLEIPVNPGHTYYVTLDAGTEDRGRYILDVFDRTSNDLPSTHTPDSAPGDDPHSDHLDNTATVMPLGNSPARVDTYIDQSDDVDVFSITPEVSHVNISAYAPEGDVKLALEVWDAQRHLLATSRFAHSDRSLFDSLLNVSLDLRPRQTYFLRLRSMDNTQGEYMLLARQGSDDTLLPSSIRTPDSRLGDDPHVGYLGENATPLSYSSNNNDAAAVYSHLDQPGDRDVFRFESTSSAVQVIGANVRDITGVRVHLYTANGVRVAPNRDNSSPVTSHMVFQEYQTVVGQSYFLVVSGNPTDQGTYFVGIRQAPSGVTSVPLPADTALMMLPGNLDAYDAVGLLGDANLDTVIDATDFNTWRNNAFQHRAGPEFGDFNVDGFVDGSDFHIWFQNRFAQSATSSDALAAARTPRAAKDAETNNTATAPLGTLTVTNASAGVRHDGHARHAVLSFRRVLVDDSSQDRPDAEPGSSTDRVARTRAIIARRTLEPHRTWRGEALQPNKDTRQPPTEAALSGIDAAFATWEATMLRRRT